MKLVKTLPALALGLAFANPALANYSVPDVPSLWPSDGAFDSSGVVPVISTKDVVSLPDFAEDESADR